MISTRTTAATATAPFITPAFGAATVILLFENAARTLRNLRLRFFSREQRFERSEDTPEEAGFLPAAGNDRKILALALTLADLASLVVALRATLTTVAPRIVVRAIACFVALPVTALMFGARRRCLTVLAARTFVAALSA
ncbi:MAG: hypothetical protein J0L53_19355, partial [Spirochaetes bacterium]|nr:hypothetical protein [Spirochaetota bacterium]